METCQTGSAPHIAPVEKTFDALPGARHFASDDLSSWENAQRRYRRLVQARHPDRRPDDASSSEFIEITLAFMQLRRQYRTTGTLPDPVRHPVPSAGPSTPVEAQPVQGEFDGIDPDPTRARSAAPPGRSIKRRVIIGLCGAGLVALLIVLLLVLDLQTQSAIQDRALEVKTETPVTLPR